MSASSRLLFKPQIASPYQHGGCLLLMLPLARYHNGQAAYKLRRDVPLMTWLWEPTALLRELVADVEARKACRFSEKAPKHDFAAVRCNSKGTRPELSGWHTSPHPYPNFCMGLCHGSRAYTRSCDTDLMCHSVPEAMLSTYVAFQYSTCHNGRNAGQCRPTNIHCNGTLPSVIVWRHTFTADCQRLARMRRSVVDVNTNAANTARVVRLAGPLPCDEHEPSVAKLRREPEPFNEFCGFPHFQGP